MKNSIFNAVCKTRYLALLLVLIFTCGNAWGQTYHLSNAVTSVSAGNMYVLVENGNALTNGISSGKLSATTSYSTTDLKGDEDYVWTLESAVNGYYLKNLGLATNPYLYNTQASGANLGFGTTSSDRNVWTISFSSTTATISCYANDRIIGNNGSNSYKAYSSPASSYPHSFTIYQLVADASYTVTWMSNGSQVRKDTDVPSGTAKTPPTISPLPCGDKLMGWTDATGGAYVHGTSNLYTGATITITGDVVLYAVFADEE